MTTNLGKIAYDRFCGIRGWRSVSGSELPKFKEQTPELQQAWNEGAMAVARKVDAQANVVALLFGAVSGAATVEIIHIIINLFR